jgi:hypothetical protein
MLTVNLYDVESKEGIYTHMDHPTKGPGIPELGGKS